MGTVLSLLSAPTPTQDKESISTATASKHDGTAPSPLFNVPPEIRNMIYRFNLAEDDKIVIPYGHAPPPEPALLSTCRQVREEARCIYYKSNQFFFICHDFDVRTPLAFSKRFAAHAAGGGDLSIYGRPHWTNFKVWVQAAFEGYCLTPGRRESEDPADRVIYMCFGRMKKMKDQGRS